MLERAALRGKYAPLHLHLTSLTSNEWSTTFEKIEMILGFDLPESARVHRPWWANQGVRGGHSHALAWEMAGWKTTQVNMADETLVFVRGAEDRAVKNFANPDPILLAKVKGASDAELSRYLVNAKAKLPDAQWFVKAIVTEQVNRGGFRNMNADSVRNIILKYAKQQKTCTYKAIADELGIKWSQAHRRLPPILGEVSEMEHEHSRPLLTAIVVSQKGVCGEGFFTMAKRAGFNFVDNERFEAEERRRVFEFWREK